MTGGRGPRVVIAGLGAMGSAAAHHLAARGARVVGLDRHSPPHAHGSSHGESRIIREAYFEHPDYVPLVRRAYRLWEELESETGRPLLTRTGALMVGPPDGQLVRGAAESARAHGLPHSVLDATQIRRRVPGLHPPPGCIGIHETRAGILDPAGCIRAHLDCAAAAGAELRSEEPLVRWRATGSGVEAVTPTATHGADFLVLAAGAWLPRLVPGLPLRIERQVMCWFRPAARPHLLRPDRCPVFLWETERGALFYGVPDLGRGVKAARHHGGASLPDPDLVDPEVHPQDVQVVRDFLLRFAPDAAGDLTHAAVCRYTNTPDGHFLLDWHPEHPRVLVVSPCSGHGFKFASVVGQVVAELVTRGESRFDLSLFRARTAV